jgi:hemin uptake protein HemP
MHQRDADARRLLLDAHRNATEHGSSMTASNEPPEQDSEPAQGARPAPARPVRVLVSELLSGGREAILEHDGQDYRLRITANGKLILTK